MAIVLAVFSSYFLLPVFVTFAPPLQLHNMQVVVYTVSDHSHTLDMAIHEHSIRYIAPVRCVESSIVVALYPVDIPRGVCVL